MGLMPAKLAMLAERVISFTNGVFLARITQKVDRLKR